MHPLIQGHYPTGLVLWGLAFVTALTIGGWLAARDGHGAGRSLAALLLLDVVFLLGTKLHFWLANWPLIREDGIGPYLTRGFHLPGGLVLGAVLGPLVLRALGLRPAAFGDSVVPAAGLAIAIARLGCLANGCCVGHPTDAPWGIAFPRGSRVHAVHLVAGLIAPGAEWSLPVVPLMLGFAAAGLGIAVVFSLLRARRAAEGQLGLGFLALWATTTAVLEPWRDTRIVAGTPRLGLTAAALALVSLAALAFLSWRRRRSAAALVAVV